MAKRKGNERNAASGAEDAKATIADNNTVANVVAKVKKARNLSMDSLEGCRSIVKLSSLGLDVLASDFSAHVAIGIDKTIESLTEASALLKDASILFAPYTK